MFVGRDMGHAPEYSQEVAGTIDAEVRRLIDDAHVRGPRDPRDVSAVLDRLAGALLERETLDAADVEELLRGAEMARGVSGSGPGIGGRFERTTGFG